MLALSPSISQTPSNLRRPGYGCLLASVVAAAILAIIPDGARAQTISIWTNNLGNNLNTASGWSNSTLPVSGNAWVFANTASILLTNNFTSFTVAGITFTNSAGATTIGGNAITLSRNIVNLSTVLQTINFQINNSGNNTINASNGNIALGGGIGGSGTLSFAGAATTTLASNVTFSSITASNSGNLIASANFTLQSGSVFNNTGTLSINQVSSAGGLRMQTGTNTVNFQGGTASLNGFAMGIGGSGNNTINISSGATVNATNTGSVGFTSPGTNVLTISGGGVFNTAGINIGQATGVGSTNAVTNNGIWSNTGAAAAITLNAQRGTNVDSRFVQAGGTFFNSQSLHIGGGIVASPTVVSNSAALVQVTGGVFSNTGAVNLGVTANQVNTTNTFQVDGGTAYAASIVMGGAGNTGSNTINLNGGVLSVGGAISSGATTQSNAINWNGGTLQAAGNGANLLNNGVAVVTVGANGGTFNAAGFSNAIGANMGGTGILRVTNSTGSGILNLTGSNSFAGVTVQAGTLIAGGSNSLGSGAATIGAGTLNLGGNTFTNAVTITSGSITNGTLSNAVVTASGGTVDASLIYSGFTAANSGNLTANGNFILLNGSVFNNSGTLSVTKGISFQAGTNTVNFQGGTATLNGFAMGDGNIGINSINISNGATVNVTNSASLGFTSSGTNALTIGGGGVLTTRGLWIGQAALNGSTNGVTNNGIWSNTVGDIALNAQRGSNYDSRFVQAGGTFFNSQSLFIGGGNAWTTNLFVSNSAALVQVTGGVFSNTGAVLLGGQTNLVNATNTFQVDGGTAYAASIQMGTAGATGSNTVNLNGGVLTVVTSISSGATTQSNAINWNGGTLQAGGSSANFLTNGVAVVTVGANGGTFNAAGFSNAIGANMGGTGILRVTNSTGSGTLNLTGSNSFAGVTVQAGTLIAGGTNALGSGAATIGGGTLNLNGNTFGNAVTLTTGVVTNGSLSNSAVTASDGTIAATLAGTTALTKNGSGTVTLSGANSNNGSTTVNAGTLIAGSSTALGNSAATVGGGTLNLGNNTFTNAVTITSGSITNGTLNNAVVTASGGTVDANLTYSGFTAANSGNLTANANFTLANGSVFNNSGTLVINQVSSAGGLRFQGGTNTLNFQAGTAATLNGFAMGISGIGNNTINISSGATVTVTNNGSMGFGSSSTNSVVIANGGVFNTRGLWIGQATVNGSTNGVTNNGTWSNTVNDVALNAQRGSNYDSRFVQAGGTFFNNQNLYIGGGNAFTTNLFVSNSAALVQVTGGVFSNTGNVYLGGQTNQINTTNTFQVDGGTAYAASIQMGTAGATGSNTVNLNGGVLTVGTSISRGAGSTQSNAINWNGGTLQAAANGANLLNNGVAVVTVGANGGTFNAAGFSNAIGANMGGTGTLSVTNSTGSGILNLTGSNSFAGVTVQAGTLIAGGSNALGSGAATIGAGTLNLGGNTFGNAVTLTTGVVTNGSLSNSAVTASSGTIAAALSGTSTLAKNGSGTLTLSGVNSYSGTTTVNAGTLVARSSTALGSSAATIGGGTLDLGNNTFGNAVTLTSGVVTNGSLSNSAVTASSGTIAAALRGTSTLAKNGSGTLTLSGINSYIGTTTVNGGVLSLGTTGTLSETASVTVNAGATLLLGSATPNSVNSSAALTLNGGTLSMGGAGPSGQRASSQTFASLTLTANSSINFESLAGTSDLYFSTIGGLTNFTLSVYNYNGTNLWGGSSSTGGAGQYTRLYAATGSGLESSLGNIRFYGGTDEGSFLGQGSFYGGSSGGFTQIVPVPEPGVVLAASMLLLWLLLADRGMIRRGLGGLLARVPRRD